MRSSPPPWTNAEPSVERAPQRAEGPAATPLAPERAPHWDDLPIALSDDQRLRVVTAAAGRARVRAGMPVPEARACCALLEILPWDEVAVAQEITRATAAFLYASPQVTPVAGLPGLWWIGASGLDGVGGERALVRLLLEIARTWSPYARVAVADSCVAARAATWQSRTAGHRSGESSGGPRRPATVIVPPGGCADYLAPAPLGLIPLEEEVREALFTLGIRTVGAFAMLPVADVERRWGPAGLAAWRLAHGDDPRRPVLTRVEARRTVSAELATPAATTEPVLFLVRAALDRLVRELITDGRSAAAVAITLTIDDRRSALPTGAPPHTITREVRPARPLARVAPLFEQCRALLDTWRLDAPVSGVAVSIPATAAASGDQGDLLAPAWRDPAAAEAAFARLRAELGPGVIVRPEARDEHRPENAGAWVEYIGASGHRDIGTSGGRQGRVPMSRCPDAPRSSRLIESPEAVDVECANGAPRVIRWRGRHFRIVHARGPERLSGDWWKDRYARDYWRCEPAEESRELLLYLEQSAWFVQGWYD